MQSSCTRSFSHTDDEFIMFENRFFFLLFVRVQLQVELNAWINCYIDKNGGWCSSVKAKNVSIIAHLCIRTIFCCVKENMIAFLSFIFISLFANKIDETDKNVIILMCMCDVCVCMFARIRLCDLMRIMMCTVKVKSEEGMGGLRAKVQSEKCRNTHTRSSNVDNKICNENRRRAASAYVIAVVV